MTNLNEMEIETYWESFKYFNSFPKVKKNKNIAIPSSFFIYDDNNKSRVMGTINLLNYKFFKK